jgi:hypothetical protein
MVRKSRTNYHPSWNKIYHTGFGGVAIQDGGVQDQPPYVWLTHLTFDPDANVPSLISIPYLGFTNNTNKVYNNTRKMLLSTKGNPYYGTHSVRGLTLY